LDPQVSYYSFDYNILQNVYETLFWYKGTSGTTVIPWLASSYSISPDLKNLTVNLRPNIKFADGESFNATAVYFSLYRLLIDDSSAPSGHGAQASWLIQQLVNNSLSSVECVTYSDCVSNFYTPAWVQAWLNTNFVTIDNNTGVTINMPLPSAAWEYLLSVPATSIVAPDYTIAHDISTWSAAGYTLPFPSPSGPWNTTIYQYLVDFASTCNTGITPSGCGATYFDNSASGSLAGTGPYTISSVVTTGVPTITLTKNSNYWGGAYNNMTAHIPTIVIKQVPEETTREIDLQAAAKSGQAMAIDVEPDNFYDVANEGDWLNNHMMVSIIPGVSLYGPYTYYSTLFDPYVSNATNPYTGTYYTFQPFADYRFREAFSDAVNMSAVLQSAANGLGVAANSAIPPGLPPAGVYNGSLPAGYSYNPDESASLLLSAMMNPLTSFTYENGTAAKAGVFDNSFGCTTLTSGTCSHPITQSIVLYDAEGDTIDDAIMTAIQTTIQNISSTYNMGLTVSVSLVPSGPLVSNGISGHYYMYALGWFADYPWSLDFSAAMYTPGGSYMAGDGWNYPYLTSLEHQIATDSSTGNTSGMITLTNMMGQFVNGENLYLWTQFPIEYTAMTSNVGGWIFNPSLSTDTANVAGPQLFAPLY
jgi:peptide/nickel transport system substrate-binding protein